MKSSFSFFISLKYKFLITTVLLIISFSSLFSYLWFIRTYHNEEKSAITYVNEILRISNDNFEYALRDINSLLTLITFNNDVKDVLSKTQYSSDKDMIEDNRKITALITGLYGYKYYLGALYITDLKDREYSLGISFSTNDLEKLPKYKDIINSNGEKVLLPPHEYNGMSGVQSNNDYSNMVISMARPILDGGKIIGAAIADIKCNILIDIFNINLKDDGTVLILDSKTGSFIFKPDLSKLKVSFNEDDYKKISDKFTMQKGNFYTRLGNKDFLVIYYYSDFSTWTTIGLIPKERLLAGFIETRNTIFSISIFFILFAAGISYFMSSVLTKNLYKLNKVMKTIDKNTLDTSVKIVSHDEIGQLYHQFNNMIIRIKELVESIKQKEKDKRKADINALQAQINPHFLYNTLNTIQFLSVLQGIENIKNVSESLSTLLHINLEERTYICIEEEIQYIKSYLSIQKYKYSNKFTSNFIIDEGVGKLMLPKLLIQPIVENSLIHGIAPMKGQGAILIKVYRENNFLRLRVQDNGIGLSEEKVKKLLDNEVLTNSIGIHNVISRIKMNFGDDYGISIWSQENMYTIVEISVPAITEEEVEKYA